MDLDSIMLSETTQRKTNTVRYHTHMEAKKHSKLVSTKSSRLTDTENKLVLILYAQQGKRRGEGVYEGRGF